MSETESKITVRWDNNETLSFLPPGFVNKGMKLDLPGIEQLLVSELSLDLMRRLSYPPSMQVGFVGDLLLRPVNINELHTLAYDTRMDPKEVESRFQSLLALSPDKSPYEYGTDPIRRYAIPDRMRQVVAVLDGLGYDQEMLTAALEADKARLNRFLKREQMHGRFRRVIRKHPGFYNNPQFKDVVATAEDNARAIQQGEAPILTRYSRQQAEALDQNVLLLDNHLTTAALYAFRGRVVGLTDHPETDPYSITDNIQKFGIITGREGGRILLLYEEFQGDHVAMVEEANRLIQERNDSLRGKKNPGVNGNLQLEVGDKRSLLSV